MAVYNVEDFFISEVTRVISAEEAIVNFLEKAAVKMVLCTGGHALKIAQLCLPTICNLHLHRLDVRSLLNLPGIYLADISILTLFTGKPAVDRVS